MAWKLFQLASGYARKLQLRSLDTKNARGEESAPVLQSPADDERRRLWDLFGKDLLYRLLLIDPQLLVQVWRTGA